MKPFHLTVETEEPEKTQTWQSLVRERCPSLFHLVSKDGRVNPQKLTHFMKHVPLKLKPENFDGREYVESVCHQMFQFYLQVIHQPDAVCETCVTDELRLTKSWLFHDDKKAPYYSVDDLKFLYRINELGSEADQSKHGTLYKLTKKRGDLIMKVTRNVHKSMTDAVLTMVFLQRIHPELLQYFARVYDSRVEAHGRDMFTLIEPLDWSMKRFSTVYKKNHSTKKYWAALEALLIHALYGLVLLQRQGFAHNDVKAENLGVVVTSRGLRTKWLDFQSLGKYGAYPQSTTLMYQDHLQEKTGHVNGRALTTDSFAFGITVYTLLHNGHHPMGAKPTDESDWTLSYMDQESPTHKNIDRLLQTKRMPHISKIAYHFIVHSGHKGVPRWTLENAVSYLRQKNITLGSKQVMPAYFPEKV